MHLIQLRAYNLPFVRDLGFMCDSDGTMRHPQRHMETIHVFVYVKKGVIHVFEDGDEYRLRAGDYLFLKKNVPHQGGDRYAVGSEWYYIHFAEPSRSMQNSSDTLPEYVYFPHSSIIHDETYSSEITLPKRGHVLNREYTESQLTRIVNTYKSVHPLRPLNVALQTYQFFIELYANDKEENKNAKKHRIITQLIELLKQASPHKLSADDIANAFGMNYAYLSTLFREQTGKSVTHFQNELVIEKALEMFQHNKGNISEISDALGFSNPFYFSRVFKRVTGVSPRTYLNEHYWYRP